MIFIMIYKAPMSQVRIRAPTCGV